MDQCKDVLVEKNLALLHQQRQSRLFLMSLVDKQFLETQSDDVKAAYGPFSGGWTHFQETYQREREHYNLQFTTSEAIAALTIESLPGAVDAWRSCMQAKRQGLFCWLEGDLSATLFTLWLEWAPPTGLDGKPLKKTSVTHASENGTSSLLTQIPSELLPGQLAVGIRRETPDVVVRGQINSIVGTGTYATTFYIPRYIPPVIILAKPYYLAQHPESLLRQHNIHRGLQFGRVYWQDTVVIAGIDYTKKALGMHAPDGVGFAEFSIPRGARYFSSVVGMARQDSTNAYGSAMCRVFVDGNLQWQAQLSGPAVAQTPKIGLPPGSAVLKLEVDGQGSVWGDHTTWGDPRFTSDADQ